MKLSVATNFDDDLIERVRDYPVAELFGKLPRDFVGGGRPSYLLAPLSRRRLAQHVRLAQASGIEFNYLLNAACLDNREFTRRGQREIELTLAWVADSDVTAIVISVPYRGSGVSRAHAPHAQKRLWPVRTGCRKRGSQMAPGVADHDESVQEVADQWRMVRL